MFVPFENLPDESKIWIYQSNRKFSDDEVTEISSSLTEFINQWATHGNALEASFVIKYNRFIVLAVNPEVQNVTGCSIDSSVEFIQSLEKKYDVDLLDKMNVTFKTGDFIAYKPLIDFKRMVKEKSVTENTIIFNNLINNVGEFKENWEVPARDSWHSRFF